MKVINKIEFNDGYIELQEDDRGNHIMCTVGNTAHKYYHKFNQVKNITLMELFDKVNNCTIVI